VKRAELAEHFIEINFTPQDACRWLSPSELKTFLASTLSAIFGNYADKRELQKVFDSNLIEMPPPDEPLAEGEAFWFDYTADIGDGFEPTYTVAALMGQESLRVDGLDAALPRGQMLVLGGDEVYPTASSKAYEDRTTGPYRSAMPSASPQPLMLALPGNHDWYDGLTAFLRLFTQDRMIGGWRTEQKRSYFTVALPHRWWLVGLDSQLDSYFDDPQLKYFEKTLTANLLPGDSVIVCCATPAWLKASSGYPDAFNGLEWFERNFVATRRIEGSNDREPTGAQARLWLTGDKHHYVRYQEVLADPAAPEGTARQLVTAGIGGAYLDVTHGLPSELELLPHASRNWREGDEETTFAIQPVTYPSLADSRAWARRLGKPWCKEALLRRNPGVFTAFAVTHFVIFLVLLLIFWQGIRADENGRIIDAYLSATPATLLRFTGGLLAVVLLAMVICLLPMLRQRPPLLAVKAMVLMLSQLVVACACFVGFGVLPVGTLGLVAAWFKFFLVIIGVSAVGGVLGAFALGVWIVHYMHEGLNSWAMMGQAIEEGKGFLRIRLDADGVLTVYSIVTDELVTDYQITPSPVMTSSGRTTKIPVPSGPLPTPRIIEKPFIVLPTSAAGPG
jgi:hypothetical protein